MNKSFLCVMIVILIMSGIIILSLRSSVKKTPVRSSVKKTPVLPRGRGAKKSLIKTNKDTFIKTYSKKHASRYFREKWCYQKTADNSHFPNLLHYDDKNLTLEFENGGVPLSIVRNITEIEKKIPNWNEQFNEIISFLEDAGIQHADWHSSNILHKNGVLKVIDFELAQLDVEHPNDRPIPYSIMWRPTQKDTSLKKYLKRVYSKISRRKKKEGDSLPYIPPNLRH